MAILRVRDNDGNVTEIPAIKGDKGDRGNPGSGILTGSYVGNGEYEQTIEIDGYVSAVLILNQKAEHGVSNDGLLIKGGFVPSIGNLLDGSYTIARIEHTPVGESTGEYAQWISYLHVYNVTYNVGLVSEYANGLNFNGTTYHYIAMMG